MIKRLIVLTTAGLVGVLSSTTAALGGTTLTATASQHPVGASGISGRITITDDTVTHVLTIHGTATGLTPGADYLSLVYNTGSSPGGPTGAVTHGRSIGPCEPTNFSLSFSQMVVGFWVNNGDGTGTLDAVKSTTSSTSGSNSNLVANLGTPGTPGLTDVLAFIATSAMFFSGTGSDLANSPSYAGLGTWSTISIRPFGPAGVQGFIEPVLACGQVAISAA